jgi:hypothetical protein
MTEKKTETAKTVRLEKLGQQAELWYRTLADFVFKHSSFQLIILGWIVSVENQIGSADPATRKILIACLLGYSVFSSGIYLELRGKSDYVAARLLKLDSDVAADCLRLQITFKFLVSVIAVHFALSLISAWLIWNVALSG